MNTKHSKSVLNIEQMRRLVEKGIDISDASLLVNGMPTYTISDILDKMPQGVSIERCGGNYDDYYFCAFSSDSLIHSTEENEAIDAVYDMLLWFIDNRKELLK